ncbi:MAG: bifunctional pyr operon transcriptional regulator/uracil phosphoribosyltransferase PyrR [Nitrospirae bacterium]|nr:bifunctional pyr operon transcriptional regulator/uracil phosphoribosyltransferase PyrR [Nitrospirota bacterium]
MAPPIEQQPSAHTGAEDPAGRTILDGEAAERVLRRIAHEALETRHPNAELALIGIRTGGDYLAQRLVELITQISGTRPPLGLLDITLYRDDLGERADQPELRETLIPFDIAGKDVLLVDDVLFTGRTIRAALNALMDFGRPDRVRLAVLVDRGHRELPIRPDIVGKNIPTERADRVRVRFTGDHHVSRVVLHPGGQP